MGTCARSQAPARRFAFIHEESCTLLLCCWRLGYNWALPGCQSCLGTTFGKTPGLNVSGVSPLVSTKHSPARGPGKLPICRPGMTVEPLPPKLGPRFILGTGRDTPRDQWRVPRGLGQWPRVPRTEEDGQS